MSWNSITIQISDEELEELKQIQDTEGLNRHAILRQALLDYLNAWDEERRQEEYNKNYEALYGWQQ